MPNPDTFGALEIPAVVPADQVIEPVGDPGLGKLGSFVAAVLNAEILVAWQGAEPVPEGDQATYVVRNVGFHDPYEYGFNDDELPAVYLWRRKGEHSQDAEERYVDATKIHVVWILPPLMREEQRARAGGLFTAIQRALGAALLDGFHASWRDASDTTSGVQPIAADADSFALAQATTTSASAIVMSGVLGTNALTTRLEPTITSAPAVGAYNTTSPVLLTVLDGLGLTRERRLFLTDPDGGETIGLGEDIARVVSGIQPGAPLTTGHLSVGNSAHPGRYSSLLERGAFEWCRLATHEAVVLQGDVLDGDRHATERRPFHALQMVLAARELLARAPRGTPIQGSGAGAAVGQSLEMHLTRTDGSVIESSALPTDP